MSSSVPTRSPNIADVGVRALLMLATITTLTKFSLSALSSSVPYIIDLRLPEWRPARGDPPDEFAHIHRVVVAFEKESHPLTERSYRMFALQFLEEVAKLPEGVWPDPLFERVHALCRTHFHDVSALNRFLREYSSHTRDRAVVKFNTYALALDKQLRDARVEHAHIDDNVAKYSLTKCEGDERKKDLRAQIDRMEQKMQVLIEYGLRVVREGEHVANNKYYRADLVLFHADENVIPATEQLVSQDFGGELVAHDFGGELVSQDFGGELVAHDFGRDPMPAPPTPQVTAGQHCDSSPLDDDVATTREEYNQLAASVQRDIATMRALRLLEEERTGMLFGEFTSPFVPPARAHWGVCRRPE